jgi:hemolysin-activating ACP:hemolysin acyltransferase
MDSSKAVVDCLYLFNQSPDHRIYTLTEFNSYAIYPIIHNKIRIFYDQDKPISLVTWCWFTNEQSDLFLQEEYEPVESDYVRTNGDQLWGIEFIAPYGHARKTMKQMKSICCELYGNNNIVHWRRLHSPDKLIKRTF